MNCGMAFLQLASLVPAVLLYAFVGAKLVSLDVAIMQAIFLKHPSLAPQKSLEVINK